MKRTWVQFLVAVLLAIVITSGPYILTYGTPEMVAGVLTLLVGIAVIVAPVLVGWVIDYLVNGPEPFNTKYCISVWTLGAVAIAFTGVVCTAGYFAIFEVYHYILNLLGG